MTKGQRAMAVAMIHPEPAKGGQAGTAAVPEGVTKQYLSFARTVLRFTPEAVPVIAMRATGMTQQAIAERLT